MTRLKGFLRSGGFMAAVVCSFAASAVRAETLSDTLASSYRNSGLLEQNRALLRAADEDVAIALSALRPIIDWSASLRRSLVDSNTTTTRTDNFISNGGTLSIGGSQLLYDGGATKLGLKAAQESVLATRESLRSIEQTVLFNGVQAYMNLVTADEFLNLALNNRRVLAEELRASQDRFDVGEVTRTDVALSEASLANAETNVASARGNQTTARATFVQVVGREAGNLVRNPRLPPRPSSVSSAQAIAVQNHPDLQALQHQIASAELTIQVARASLKPDLRLRLDANVNNTFDSQVYSDSVEASINLTQRIYQGGALTAQIRRAIASRDALWGNLLTTQRAVEQEVAAAFSALEAARANIVSTAERVRAAQVAFDGVREEARLGSRTTLDVLTSEQDLLDARASAISAQAEQYVAAYRLVAAQGLMSAERLGLQVPVYDVNAYYNTVKTAPSITSKQGRELDRVLRAIGRE